MEVEKKYYKYIDFIRIIFCVSVLLYHLNVLKGGYLAVCSFFTLSGFLSYISIANKDHFSLKNYYLKKLLKLYLPLIVVVFITVFCVSLSKNIIWLNLKPEVTSVVLSYNNFWQLKVNMNYFSHQISSPFVHLWFISILIQFDLLFPFFYFAFKKIGEKFGKIFSLIIISIISIISCLLFYNIYLNGNVMTSYYSTFLRLFSLLFGVALGYIHFHYKPIIPKFLSDLKKCKIVFIFYLLVLILLFIFVSENSFLFALSMILTSLITCRLIDYGKVISLSNLSENKLLKNLSGISYEIYLVQYPVIYLFQYVKMNEIIKNLIMILLIFLISYILKFVLSFEYKKKKILKIFLSILLLCIFIVGLYQYFITADHTSEMKALEQQLSKNELIMQEKKEEYEQRLEQKTNDLNEKLEQLAIDENNLDELITNLNIIGIGDSVMLGATFNLYEKFPNGYFDAEISRSAYVVGDIVQNLKNNNMLGNPIVIHLGTNGDCPDWYKEIIMDSLKDKEVFWLNVTNDSMVNVNDNLFNFALKYNNLHIIDWNQISSGHNEYFYSDGIHLTDVGREAYVNTIYDSIYNFYYEKYQEKKNEIIETYEKETEITFGFYGNDVLLNIYDEMESYFIDAEYEINKDFTYESLIKFLNSKVESSNLPEKIILAFDNSLKLTEKNYQDLVELCKNHDIYILDMTGEIKSYLFEYENVTIINFYQEIQSNKNYLLADKIHLSSEGNDSLFNILKSVLAN